MVRLTPHGNGLVKDDFGNQYQMCLTNVSTKEFEPIILKETKSNCILVGKPINPTPKPNVNNNTSSQKQTTIPTSISKPIAQLRNTEANVKSITPTNQNQREDALCLKDNSQYKIKSSNEVKTLNASNSACPEPPNISISSKLLMQSNFSSQNKMNNQSNTSPSGTTSSNADQTSSKDYFKNNATKMSQSSTQSLNSSKLASDIKCETSSDESSNKTINKCSSSSSPSSSSNVDHKEDATNSTSPSSNSTKLSSNIKKETSSDDSSSDEMNEPLYKTARRMFIDVNIHHHIVI